MEEQLSFPEIIVVEKLSDQGRANLATSVPLVKQVINESTKGAVDKDGKWVQDPGGWQIEKLNTGQYKVTHNWGYFNISLSVTVPNGSAQIIENHPTYFRVDTYINGVLEDTPFIFTLAKVITPQP